MISLFGICGWKRHLFVIIKNNSKMKLIYLLFMILFYGVYLVIGALVFQWIEESREKDRCEKTLEELEKFNMTEKQTSYQELHEFSVNISALVQVRW